MKAQGLKVDVFQRFWVREDNWPGYFLLGSFIFCYANVFAALIETWWKNDVYTHGFLIPFASLYFIWIQRDKFSRLTPSGNYFLGLPILLSGIFLLLTGHVGSVLLIQEFSIIVSIMGIVISVLGTRYFIISWIPIAYLVLMLPILRIFTNNIYFPFQLFTAKMSIALLQLFGIPSFRESIYIQLPNITLKVARECAGLNYLISIIAIGIPMAFFITRSWPKRITFLSVALAIAVLANGIRVTMIGILSYYGVSATLHGPYHVLQAMFVAVAGFGALFLGAWIVLKSEKSSPATDLISPQSSQKQISKEPMDLKKLKPSMLLVSGLLLAVGAYTSFDHSNLKLLKRDFSLFPVKIGEWVSKNSSPDFRVFREMGVDRELSRTYQTASGDKVKLYIGYFESQTQGKELVSYKSDEIHDESSHLRINLSPKKYIDVNKAIKGKGSNSKLVVFWYYLNGRVVKERHIAKAYTILDSLTTGHSNGAVIMVSANIFNNESDEQQKHIEAFIKEMDPIQSAYIP